MKQAEHGPPLGSHCTIDIPHQPLRSSVVITLLAQGKNTDRGPHIIGLNIESYKSS